MLYTNKYSSSLVLIFACTVSQVIAQSLTVESAIEEAKQKKLNPPVVKNDAASTPVAAAALTLPKTNPDNINEEPKLWSIKGVKDDLIAEIIYKNTIHSVKLREKLSFADWTIVEYDSESVTLVKHQELSSSPKKKKKNLVQPAPIKLFISPTGSSITKFNIQPDGEINTLQRQAASNLPTRPVDR